jgi:hypothetical protein
MNSNFYSKVVTLRAFFKYQLTIADKGILVLSIILLILLYKYYWITGQAANYAKILVDNSTPQQIDLQSNRQISVQGHLGESRIEIMDGRIRFIDSPCRGKYCIQAGWLSKNGDFIACLPNHVSLELHDSQETQFDSIVY